MDNLKNDIKIAKDAINLGDFELARNILRPLAEKDVPAAVRLISTIFDANTPEDEIDKIFVAGMFKAAELGDLEALYQVGVFYDLGEYGIQQDQRRASEIFKKLSDAGYSHCMWIHACELLWGLGAFPINVEEGLTLLDKAIEHGSAGACITKANFYHNGEFSFSIDLEKRDVLRVMAIKLDDTIYDPFA